MKHLIIFLIFIICLGFESMSYGQTTYYFSWSYGNDNNAGTSITAPKKSYDLINNASSGTFSRGTIFKFLYGDEWDRTDHTSGNRNGSFVPSWMDGCTFEAYSYTYLSDTRDSSDGKPTFDGEGGYAIYMGGKDYDGIQTGNIFRKLKFYTSSTLTGVGYLTRWGGQTTSDGDWTTADSLRVVSCEFDASNLDNISNETFGISGNYTIWDSNYVYADGNARQGLYMAGTGHTIRYNIHKDFKEAGIKLNDWSDFSDASYTSIYGNLCIDCGIGIRIGETNHNNVFSNVIIFTSGETSYGKGIQLLAETETNPQAGNSGARQNKIYNNTIIINGEMSGNTVAGIDVSHAGYNENPNWSTYADNDIKNNIVYIYNEGDEGGTEYLFYISDGVTDPIPSDYNFLYSDGSWKAFWDSDDGGDDTYTSFEAYAGSTGTEANSVTTDPSFASHSEDSEDPADYVLSGTSLAIDGGTSVSLWGGVTLTDFYGNSIVGTQRDIGAFESEWGGAPSAPQNLSVTDSGNPDEHPLLSWDANTEPDMKEYKIYRSESSSSFSHIATTADTITSYKDSDVTTTYRHGDDFNYKITAVDLAENESGYSNTEWIEARLLKEMMDENAEDLPKEYALNPNYPNPFNPSTQITYQIPDEGFVKLVIYNSLGQVVETLVNQNQNIGRYSIGFNAGNLASGLYFYSLKVNDFSSVKKMLLMK